MRILLVSPDFKPETRAFTSESSAAEWSPFQVGILPLGLATVAALTPDDVEVDIWDESVAAPIDDRTRLEGRYDLAGVTGYVNHAGRVNELGRILRRRGLLTVVGGPGVSSEPERYRDAFDVLFIGEAEHTWPRFLADWRAGAHRPEYRQVGKPDVTLSPPPKWDKVDIGDYLLGAVQTTRGCPFDCEFCDVIYIYGRRPRHKTVAQVLEEVAALERRGVSRILLCDDNFIGQPRYAKRLLRALVELNRSFRRPLSFFTNLTLNVARDDELLELLADANFPGVFIGIESPNRASLIETNKPQNYKTDMVADVRKIHGYGILVQSGLIVGFDHDDETIFDQHFDFLEATGVPVPMINLLKAPTGTKLWARLHKEGRVLENPELKATPNVESLTNVAPKLMSMARLLGGYLELLERVRDWRAFERRVRSLVAQVRRRPRAPQRLSLRETLLTLRLLSQMDRDARATTLRLVLYTLRRAPFLLERVVGAVAYQYQERQRLPHLRAAIAGRVRALAGGEPGYRRERAVFFVPEAFKAPYRRLFPSLYERVRRGLDDPGRAQNALVEATGDFLTRWGPSFRTFERHHRGFLGELCDRAVAAENAGPRRGGGEAEPPPRSAFQLRRMADEVLRCVEQDLRAFPDVAPGQPVG